MTRRVDEVFEAQNQGGDAATAIQTLGKLGAEQEAGHALPEPSQSLPRVVAVVILVTAVVPGGVWLGVAGALLRRISAV